MNVFIIILGPVETELLFLFTRTDRLSVLVTLVFCKTILPEVTINTFYANGDADGGSLVSFVGPLCVGGTA